ncbi:MAG TPA: 3'-5' exonuclease, partial [Candidatus Binatia bacterium]|nr:3'-5' exonuclease [Candidatus Binatia bacterium]
MRSVAGLAALQEDLPLQPSSRFEFTIDVASLGLDPDLVEAVASQGPLCFLDFEATGLDPATDELIEAGAILIEPGQRHARVFNSLVHTTHDLTPFIKRLTGISQEDVAGAPP